MPHPHSEPPAADPHPDRAALRSGVTLNLFRGCLVATLPADLAGETLPLFRRQLLARLAHERVRHVVLDCAGLEILDPDEFAAVGQVASMARLLGAECVLAGLRPGIVAALIAMEVEVGPLRAALDLDEALRLFEEEEAPPREPGGMATPTASPAPCPAPARPGQRPGDPAPGGDDDA